MIQKLLSGLGVLSLVVWTVAGAAAWYSVKQKVQFTISETPGHDSRRVDRVALVEEAVAELRQDVQALAHALETDLGSLATDLESGNAKRIAELKSSLDNLEQRLSERDGALAELTSSSREHRAMLETVLAEVKTSSNARPPEKPAVTLAMRESARERQEAKPDLAEKPAPAKQPAKEAVKARKTAVAEVEPKPPVRRFLSFRLPSASFAFDKLQSFDVIASLSRVGFDAKSTLHDFSGVTSKISGSFTSNLAKPSGTTKGSITVEAGTLDTGLESRNSAMHDDHLQVGKFPNIVFELLDVRSPKADGKAMTVSGTAVGKMTIHGVTRDLSMPIRAKVDASRRLFVEGETKLKLSDYEIPRPTKLGLISMQDEVNVWISLRARPGVQ